MQKSKQATFTEIKPDAILNYFIIKGNFPIEKYYIIGIFFIRIQPKCILTKVYYF